MKKHHTNTKVEATCLKENIVQALVFFQSKLHIPVERLRVLIGGLVNGLGGARVERFPPAVKLVKWVDVFSILYEETFLFASAMSRLPNSRSWLVTCSSMWNLKNRKSLLLAPLNAYFMLSRNWTTFLSNS